MIMMLNTIFVPLNKSPAIMERKRFFELLENVINSAEAKKETNLPSWIPVMSEKKLVFISQYICPELVIQFKYLHFLLLTRWINQDKRMHDKPIINFEKHVQHCQTALDFYEWLCEKVNLLDNADYLRSVVLLKNDKYFVSWKKTSLFNEIRPWISLGFINPIVEELSSSVIESLNDDPQNSKTMSVNSI